MKSFNTIINEQMRPLKKELSFLKIELRHAKRCFLNCHYEVTDLQKRILDLKTEIQYLRNQKIKKVN
jgi:predicted  nucleic acid-binding Zn-ribbon protein